MATNGNKKDVNIFIGSNIKRERELAGLTQDQFSDLLGIGTKSLSAIERGQIGISMHTLKKVCATLSISSDAIIFGEPPKNDVSLITRKLERLTPQQFKITNKMFSVLLSAFATNDTDHE